VSEVAAARERLGARQQEVLGALLAGQVPPGFDVRTTRSAAAQLRGKRRHEAAAVCPPLLELPGFAVLFDDWARTARRAGCGHDDVRAFLAAVGDRPEVRWWRMERQVLAGHRSVAWIRRRGRRELLVGVGPLLWRLAWRSERADPGPTVGPGGWERERT